LLSRKRRYSFEFRHPSWYTPQTLRLLSDQNISLCLRIITTYRPLNRLHQGHGPGGRYKGHYRPAALADWSPRIRCWKKQGYDVYMYFDNAAPADALKLAQLLK